MWSTILAFIHFTRGPILQSLPGRRQISAEVPPACFVVAGYELWSFSPLSNWKLENSWSLPAHQLHNHTSISNYSIFTGGIKYPKNSNNAMYCILYFSKCSYFLLFIPNNYSAFEFSVKRYRKQVKDFRKLPHYLIINGLSESECLNTLI